MTRGLSIWIQLSKCIPMRALKYGITSFKDDKMRQRRENVLHMSPHLSPFPYNCLRPWWSLFTETEFTSLELIGVRLAGKGSGLVVSQKIRTVAQDCTNESKGGPGDEITQHHDVL